MAFTGASRDATGVMRCQAGIPTIVFLIKGVFFINYESMETDFRY